MIKHAKPAIAVSILVLAVLICETLARPHVDDRYSLAYFAFNYTPMVLLSLLLLAVTNKSIFSASLSGVAGIALVAVSNAKLSVLEKPLLPSDFLLAPYFFDSRLYLKYINLSSGLCAALAVLGIVALYRIERKQTSASRYFLFLRVVLAGFALSFFTNITDADSFVSRTYSRNSLPYATWDPLWTVKSSGLFFTLIRMSEGLDFEIPDQYGDASLIEKIATPPPNPAPPATKEDALPDIVVVQSESFYDLRQHQLAIGRGAYADYDTASGSAAVSGSLFVPTVGGNTIKTEFSFLTGIDAAVLPPGCEYPYSSLVKRNIWSIAWHLKGLGYRTVAIHPYFGTFWDRNITLPFLGFDEFIDMAHFPRTLREGPFISDRAVADRIATERERTRAPVFIFAITMENHGPWDQKRVTARRKFPIKGDLDAHDRMRVGRYLHHVAHAGNMAYTMTQELARSERRCVLAFYGDHAPGFGESFDKLPLKPGKATTQTPYFIWKNFGATGHTSRDIGVSFLAGEVLDQAGVNNDVYFRANSYFRQANKGTFNGIAQSRELQRSYTQLLYNNLLGKLGEERFPPKAPL